MIVTVGRYDTANGSKYLQQLCKHFAHKVTVDYNAEKGTVEFPMGKAFMRADETGLTIRIELDTEDAEPMAHNVIDRHLERFAFREPVKVMTWTREISAP